MEFLLNLNVDTVIPVFATKFKQDERLLVVDLKDYMVGEYNRGGIKTVKWYLVDKKYGVYVFEAESKKKLYEAYENGKKRYENVLANLAKNGHGCAMEQRYKDMCNKYYKDNNLKGGD